MFSNTKAEYLGGDTTLVHSICLSTDEKPTAGIQNGSVCIEMDTGKKYAFDEDGKRWIELSSGGGNGDLSIAVLTVINNRSDNLTFEVPVASDGELGDPDITLPVINPINESTETFNVILYKGKAILFDVEQVITEAEGKINLNYDEGVIYGDCTIKIDDVQ